MRCSYEGVGRRLGEPALRMSCAVRCPRWEDLAGVERLTRPEGGLELRHSVHVLLREHERHVLLLLQTDAVFSRQDAARVEAYLQYLAAGLQRSIGVSGLAFIEENERMQITVPRVKQVGDGQTGTPLRPSPPL